MSEIQWIPLILFILQCIIVGFMKLIDLIFEFLGGIF